ncbi:MAG: extracellular solute-binding protein [Propionibacteriaceae bacterium]|jgi:ABC-type glycerol-3-phosphate transport system substrate-binding protein|nr:extracellular solute-binding protein [Propionibacteriaceae bacterium]
MKRIVALAALATAGALALAGCGNSGGDTAATDTPSSSATSDNTTSLATATIIAPGWAHWSIGDLVQKDGKDVREWNDATFGVYPLPGNDGKPAPVFAGGSNIGISAASPNQAGARELMRLIFSADYQQLLGKNGLGPANSDYVSSLGTDEFAKALIDSASNSKLTPAAPGWATVEASGKLEEFFSKVADGGDVAALAAEYDAVFTPLLNGKTSSGNLPDPVTDPGDASGQNITLWLIGADTPDEARTWLKEAYAAKTGGTLTIEEQTWGDIVTKLTTSLPDANNTPDVTEIGNTQSPTFTNVGAFADITDMYEELGGSKLLQSFVDVGAVDGKNYTLPYYFGSRYIFYRKDIYAAAGVSVPTTLTEFNEAVVTITEKNPNGIDDFSGFFLGGQDWRNGISWIFANGGDLAKFANGEWTSTLSDPNTIKGLEQLQTLFEKASKAPNTAKDESPWLYINDSDVIS